MRSWAPNVGTTRWFIPSSNGSLEAGHFWAIPLSDGRFACGRVLRPYRVGSPGPPMFIGSLLDWVGADAPTSEAIAGAPLLAVGHVPVSTIGDGGGSLVGYRPLEADGIVVPSDVGHHYTSGFFRKRAELRFVSGEPTPQWEIRDVSSPLTDHMLRPLKARFPRVQFSKMLSPEDLLRLAGWLRDQPDAMLRVYGSYGGSITDLEFLRHFPFLLRFGADHNSLTSLSGLRHLPENLEQLGIGRTRSGLDLEILGRFQGLRSLWLEGQTKNIGVISRLPSLEDLTLRSITLPDLALLRPLVKLAGLDIKLGGTHDLGLLPEIGEIRYLELWMIRGLTDLSPVGRMRHLRYLFLQALRRVEKLPDLSQAVELRRVVIDNLKGVHDLSALATAPALEDVSILDMRHLQPADLRCLVGMPRLKGFGALLGGQGKDQAVKAMFGLPKPRAINSWRDL